MREDFWAARVDLAAVLRWSARLGYQQGVCNHFSFLLPGQEDLFLVNAEVLRAHESPGAPSFAFSAKGGIRDVGIEIRGIPPFAENANKKCPTG
jgi:hypothetical protein